MLLLGLQSKGLQPNLLARGSSRSIPFADSVHVRNTDVADGSKPDLTSLQRTIHQLHYLTRDRARFTSETCSARFGEEGQKQRSAA
jgi:hypothetical protein